MPLQRAPSQRTPLRPRPPQGARPSSAAGSSATRRAAASTRRSLPPPPSASQPAQFSIFWWLAAILLVVAVRGLLLPSAGLPAGIGAVPASVSSIAANNGRAGCGAVGTASFVESRLEASLNELLHGSPSQPFAHYFLNNDRKRLRQETDVGSTRALTMHFAGSGSAFEKHRAARSIADALFVGGTGKSLLDVDCAAEAEKVESGGAAEDVLDALKNHVLEVIRACPKSVVILQNIEELPLLYGQLPGVVIFERLFEETFVDYRATQVDLRMATFILTSNVGAPALRSRDITAGSFYERQPADGQSHATSEVTRIINEGVAQWLSRSRPALGGRLSNSAVPFV